MGEYDRAMKLLVAGDPRAIVQFVLQQARIARKMTIRIHNIEILSKLSTEFQGVDADADGLLLVTAEDGRQFLVHIEFQSTRDPFMADRLLDYCLRARRTHSPKEGPPLPIISCVIYLRDVGNVPEPPLIWELFEDEKNLVFDYLSIKLYELPREDILALNQPGLLPLSLLTRDGINRTIVKSMFDELLANKLNDLLPVGHTIATWVLGATDLAWLKREYNNMLDFFKDSPAYKWMTDDAREEERQQNLEMCRQTIVMLVAARFPKLERLAKKQVRVINDMKSLQQVNIKCSLAKDADEVETLLLDLDEDEEK
jgi:predicted transposase YdaD